MRMGLIAGTGGRVRLLLRVWLSAGLLLAAACADAGEAPESQDPAIGPPQAGAAGLGMMPLGPMMMGSAGSNSAPNQNPTAGAPGDISNTAKPLPCEVGRIVAA